MTFYTAREDALTSRFERLVAGWTGPGPAPRHRGGPEGHVFLWDDLAVRFHPMPAEEVPGHLADFVAFVRSIGAEASLEERVRATRQVVGTVIEPGLDAEGRAEALCVGLAEALEPLVVLPDGVYDAAFEPLLAFGAPGDGGSGEGGSGEGGAEAAPREVEGAETASPEAIERKARSMARLRAEGVPVLEALPCIEAKDQARIRSREEIVERAIALLLVALRGEGLEVGPLRGLVEEWGAELSPAEAAFVAEDAPSDRTRVQFAWRYEGLGVMLWALGHLSDEELGDPRSIVDVPAIVKRMMELGPAGFRAAGERRSAASILDAADLAYRYDWAVVDARVHGRRAPAGLDPGVVYERHYALNWLIGYQGQAWDEVTTDT